MNKNVKRNLAIKMLNSEPVKKIKSFRGKHLYTDNNNISFIVSQKTLIKIIK